MRRRIMGLFAANMVTFAVVGLSFIAYSKLLSPPEFGLYAVALSAATLLALVLDGGLKTSIIKMEQELSVEQESSIAVLMLGVSAVLILALTALQHPLLSRHAEIKHDVRFIVLYVGIALFFYPFVTLPTAQLERKLEYGHIAWIESVGMILERGAPALFLIWTGAGIYSFVWALILSRIFRTTVLSGFHAIKPWRASLSAVEKSLGLLREGGWIQFGMISSVVRDNLHTLLVGPFFGKEWIGYYAWALQICLVSSQLFVQLASRVSLPILAQADGFKERWPKCLYQVRLLTILTVPVLCGVWLSLPAINAHFFHDKWAPALTLIPLLFLRMVPGVATTPLGPLIMVNRGGREFALANFLWTMAEIGGGLLLLALVGPTGLAWSYAIVVWPGLWIMLNSLRNRTTPLTLEVTREMLKRPSVIFAFSTVCVLTVASKIASVSTINAWMTYLVSLLLILGSYVLEPDLRRLLVHEKA